MEETRSPASLAEIPQPSFLLRHQFLIYRLFSLAGIMPIGGYMVVHLLTNATILDSVASFQTQVDRIHSLGVVLPLVEWTFIFLPILFHATVGWFIISGAVPNTNQYRYTSNVRYVLQRGTGIIAFFFILFHVIHLHHLGSALGGGKFEPEASASSAGAAIQAALWIQVVYAIGVLACTYHLCNGLWTAGITWGVWTSPCAQRRANVISIVAGIFLATVGLSALWGFSVVKIPEAEVIEGRMEEERQRALGQDVPSQAKPAVESGKPVGENGEPAAEQAKSAKNPTDAGNQP